MLVSIICQYVISGVIVNVTCSS